MPIMRQFHRAIKKCLRDSLFVAATARYKEDSLNIVCRLFQHREYQQGAPIHSPGLYLDVPQ